MEEEQCIFVSAFVYHTRVSPYLRMNGDEDEESDKFRMNGGGTISPSYSKSSAEVVLSISKECPDHVLERLDDLCDNFLEDEN